MHKLAPIPPTIFQNEVIRMKNKKMRAKIASQSLKYTPPLCCENIFLIGAKLLQLEILSLKLSAMLRFVQIALN